MNCLLVPTLALDGGALIERFAGAVDWPVKHKVVINNGRHDALDEFRARHPDWWVIWAVKNLGCAGSWNLFPQLFPHEEACLICNDDEELMPGALKRICEASNKYAKDHSIIYVNKCESLGFFVWTKRGIERFGTFDENFWPAYREDWDMKARFKTQKPDHVCIVDDLSFPVKHGKPRPCSAAYHDTLNKIWQVDEGYFNRKWGDLDDWHSWYSNGPKFQTPFNDPSLTIKDWKLDPEVRAKREAIWYAWFNGTDTIY